MSAPSRLFRHPVSGVAVFVTGVVLMVLTSGPLAVPAVFLASPNTVVPERVHAS